MEDLILPLSDARATLDTVGGKGASLARLSHSGLPVPGGFHVTTAAYRQFVAANHLEPRILKELEPVSISYPASLEKASRAIGELFATADIPGEIAQAIVAAYANLPGPNPAVAVRSSATAEDLPEASFAGQQETYLNLSGAPAVLEATKKCWASLWTARAIGYRLRQEIPPQSVALAVVIQILVPAESAGILFTANPLNGRRDQMVINAAWGLGEAIVGGQVTPDSVIVEKVNGHVIERQTADKSVMTLPVEGGTVEAPAPESLRRSLALSDAQVTALARLGLKIEELYGTPMDIEWAWENGNFSILQARPVTALPELQPAMEWKLPKPKGFYMRGSVVDLLPDPLSPLFKTMGLPILIAQFTVLMRRLLKSETVWPADYYTTINGYAYMSGNLPPKFLLWALTLIPAFPRLLKMALPFWRDVALPQYRSAIAIWDDKDLESIPPAALWLGINELVTAALLYVATLQIATMGTSAGSEGLLTIIYNKTVRREGDPPANTLLMGYNSIPVQAEKSLYDLASWAGEHPELAEYLRGTPGRQIAVQLKSQSPPVGIPAGAWQTLTQRFDQHLKNFGYIIYELDFARPLPLDDPALMLEVCKLYLDSKGANPHERQRLSQEKRLQTAKSVSSRLRGLRRWAFQKSLKFAQELAEVREDALAEIGLGYPLLRRMLLETGHHLVAQGVIEQADDVFWLEKEEIDRGVDAIERGAKIDPLTEPVKQRKAFWKAAKQLTPPPILPPKKKYMGMKVDAFVAASESDQVGNTLKGIGASAGKITAPACVLHGPEDFARMKPGAVLVASITTPAWTPLFVMASAVVTDVGGPLSHGSIVAREYCIPAVMGTGVGTRRIHDGQVITVDGNAGTVTLEAGR